MSSPGPRPCAILTEDNSQGEGIGVACSGNGTREQCDPDSNVCYCLFPTGEEATGTRVPMTERTGFLCQGMFCFSTYNPQVISCAALFIIFRLFVG